MYVEEVPDTVTTIRTDSSNTLFQELVTALDAEMAVRDGEDHAFYAPFNKTDNMKFVVLACKGEEAVGCGALREHSGKVMEVKRMFVPLQHRGKGIASVVLLELEKWAREMHYEQCILETGANLPEAIQLNTKNKYVVIPNYGPYANKANSICFGKQL